MPSGSKSTFWNSTLSVTIGAPDASDCGSPLRRSRYRPSAKAKPVLAAWNCTARDVAAGPASTRGSVAANTNPGLFGWLRLALAATVCRLACRLYGALVESDRKKPGDPASSEKGTTGVAASASIGPPAPPENTSAGTPKTGSSSASVVRTLRTLPTSVGSAVW